MSEDTFNEDVFLAIVALRGGIPESCSFCLQPFTKENYATPEECGEWACIQCVRKWDEQYGPPPEAGDKAP